MDRECNRRLVKVDTVMAWCVVLARLNGCDKVQVRGAHGRRRRRSRLVRLDGRNMSLWCGAGTEVVRQRRPSRAEASRIHAWDHGHDVGDV